MGVVSMMGIAIQVLRTQQSVKALGIPGKDVVARGHQIAENAITNNLLSTGVVSIVEVAFLVIVTQKTVGYVMGALGIPGKDVVARGHQIAENAITNNLLSTGVVSIVEVAFLVIVTQKTVGYVMGALGIPGKDVALIKNAMNVVQMMIVQMGKNV